jgi:hypothetical protein
MNPAADIAVASPEPTVTTEDLLRGLRASPILYAPSIPPAVRYASMLHGDTGRLVGSAGAILRRRLWSAWVIRPGEHEGKVTRLPTRPSFGEIPRQAVDTYLGGARGGVSNDGVAAFARSTSSGAWRDRITRPRTPHRAHASSATSKPSSRLRPSVAMVTSEAGRASAEATQREQIKPWAALTTSRTVGHNGDVTAPRQ